MTYLQNTKLIDAVKKYDLSRNDNISPISCSEEFKQKMGNLIQRKQFNYNARIFTMRFSAAVLAVAMFVSFVYLMLVQQNPDADILIPGGEDGTPYPVVMSTPVSDTDDTDSEILKQKTSALVAYMHVLLDQRKFFSWTANKNLSINQLNQTVSDDSDVAAKATKFTLIDLDNDGVPEVVLRLTVNGNDHYGTVVLFYRDGVVQGHTIWYRQLFELKADGTFSFSGGASDHGFGTLDLSKIMWSIDEITYCESDTETDNVLFFVNKESATRDEFNMAIFKQMEKADAKWHELTDDNATFIFERQITYESLMNEESNTFQTVAKEAAVAMIRADITKLSALMIDVDMLDETLPYLIDFYDELEFLRTTWSPENIRLPSFENIRLPIEIYASYEYLIKGDDSLGYVSMILVKVDDEWKVREIYFEK